MGGGERASGRDHKRCALVGAVQPGAAVGGHGQHRQIARVSRALRPFMLAGLLRIVVTAGGEAGGDFESLKEFVTDARDGQIFPVRNALILVLTTAGLQFGSLMGQTVIVEKLFSWPGVGSLLVDTIFQRDIPVVQGCVLLIILVFLVVNLAVDVLYALIDPRIEYR